MLEIGQRQRMQRRGTEHAVREHFRVLRRTGQAMHERGFECCRRQRKHFDAGRNDRIGFAIGLGAAALGLALAWAYSAPPVRLKQNGWWGNAACALSYEGLAWLTGAAVVLGDVLPQGRSIVLALLFSFGAHGIMTLNDFKSIEGDQRMGVGSLPVRLGVSGAARTACLMMLAPQAVVVVLLLMWQAPWHALAVTALLLAQLPLMHRFTKDPVGKALMLSAAGVPLFVSGMMVSAWALRLGHGGTP